MEKKRSQAKTSEVNKPKKTRKNWEEHKTKEIEEEFKNIGQVKLDKNERERLAKLYSRTSNQIYKKHWDSLKIQKPPGKNANEYRQRDQFLIELNKVCQNSYQAEIATVNCAQDSEFNQKTNIVSKENYQELMEATGSEDQFFLQNNYDENEIGIQADFQEELDLRIEMPMDSMSTSKDENQIRPTFMAHQQENQVDQPLVKNYHSQHSQDIQHDQHDLERPASIWSIDVGMYLK
ncbi:hypothetical protein FGO68_gene5199 [Halteria grandinella]|uniref:Uncharacterized protein n=1 Tax=Halteria grandinella TaxID=5974 RepID=A0A8J8SZR5_HALGN|nr:hypothetical protein FGO68_gene5199 [Halteria grandinella]